MLISHGRSCNGLDWRTGLVLLYVLNQARHSGTPYIEPLVSATGLLTQEARFGGSARPFHSSSHNWRPPRGDS